MIGEARLVKTLAFTCLALIAFAANSVLCRGALGEQSIDAASFTSIRLFAGALVLFVITRLNHTGSRSTSRGNWPASVMLFTYAITFSFAYISLDTGTGALILFGAVQITMILVSFVRGNRLHLIEWLGVALAFVGFVYLLMPEVSTPSLLGFVLMTIAGMAWGLYTLKGRGSAAPLMDTAYNFIRTLPLVGIVMLFSLPHAHFSTHGVVLAILSGGIASGIGYTLWYIALGGLTATQAAVVQLFVPVIAAFGGVIFVAEPITVRLTLAGLLILGGILLVVLGRYYFNQRALRIK